LISKHEAQAASLADLHGRLVGRMVLLCMGGATLLRPRYQSDSTVIDAMKSAVANLFADREWLTPPHDADSPKWWDTLRGILDSFVADPSFA
jgi:hypothetical protein